MSLQLHFQAYVRKGAAVTQSKRDIQHGRYLENWYLEAGRDLGTSEADAEVGVL